MKFSEKVGNGPLNKWLNFSGAPNHRIDTGIAFRIRQYWEIRKVVNGHKSAADIDSPAGGTDKTYLGGGMHSPSASSINRTQKWAGERQLCPRGPRSGQAAAKANSFCCLRSRRR